MRRWVRCGLPLVAMLMAWSGGPAWASSDAAKNVKEEIKTDVRNYVNLRAGATSGSENGRPNLCGEVTIWSGLSIEGCGTGAGFLHKDPGAEVAHFRAKWSLVGWQVWGTRVHVQPAIGFAELQIGADEPGFRFGSPDTDDAIETAGPEISTSVQWLVPIDFGFELIMDTTAGAAWFQHGPNLVVPQSRFLPFAEVSLGVGW